MESWNMQIVNVFMFFSYFLESIYAINQMNFIFMIPDWGAKIILLRTNLRIIMTSLQSGLTLIHHDQRIFAVLSTWYWRFCQPDFPGWFEFLYSDLHVSLMMLNPE